MFERLGEIIQYGERFKSEAEEPPVQFEKGYLVHLHLSFLLFKNKPAYCQAPRSSS